MVALDCLTLNFSDSKREHSLSSRQKRDKIQRHILPTRLACLTIEREENGLVCIVSVNALSRGERDCFTLK